METVVYMPARGGSKRVPRKNIRSFHGSPALGHVIQIVRRVGIEHRVYVSTDNAEIAEVARTYEANVLHRSTRFADDHTDLLTVIRNDLPQVHRLNPDLKILICILPTALLMSSADLKDAYARVVSQQTDFVMSVGQFHYPIQRALRMSEDASLTMFQPDNYDKRSQDLASSYHDAGQFYVGTLEGWLSRRTMFEPKSTGWLVNRIRICDIDVEDDWAYAETIWDAIAQQK